MSADSLMDDSSLVTRYSSLLYIALAEFLAMSLWFAASAVAPQIAKEWHLDAGTTTWLTLSVQVGFVAGTLISALLNLPDVFKTRHVFAASAPRRPPPPPPPPLPAGPHFFSSPSGRTPPPPGSRCVFSPASFSPAF